MQAGWTFNLVYSVENHWPAADTPSACTRPAAPAPLSMGSTVDKPSLDVLAAWQPVSTWARGFTLSVDLRGTWLLGKRHLAAAETLLPTHAQCTLPCRTGHDLCTGTGSIQRRRLQPLYLTFHSNPLQPSSASNTLEVPVGSGKHPTSASSRGGAFGAECPLLANVRLDAS